MKTWLLRLFNRPAPAVVVLKLGEPTMPMDQHPFTEDWQSRRQMLDEAVLAWLTQCEPDSSDSLGERERQVLQRLAARVADPASHASLLPRAAGVVPALLARLRSESSSLRELTEHVSRDPALVAEVVAMANSAFYRRERPVLELSHSIQMLGEGGLRAAIARVVLKPMLDGRSGPLVKRSAPRLWQHTEFKTQLGAEIAHSHGRDPFDAYLLALLHDMAWTVVLRELDDVSGWRLSVPFVTELGRWRDRMSALIAQQWRPHGPWVQAAVELAQHGVGDDSAPAVMDLFAADELAWLLCNPDRVRARELAEPLLVAAQPAVRACYEDLHPTAARRD